MESRNANSILSTRAPPPASVSAAATDEVDVDEDKDKEDIGADDDDEEDDEEEKEAKECDDDRDAEADTPKPGFLQIKKARFGSRITHVGCSDVESNGASRQKLASHLGAFLWFTLGSRCFFGLLVLLLPIAATVSELFDVTEDRGRFLDFFLPLLGCDKSMVCNRSAIPNSCARRKICSFSSLMVAALDELLLLLLLLFCLLGGHTVPMDDCDSLHCCSL